MNNGKIHNKINNDLIKFVKNANDPKAVHDEIGSHLFNSGIKGKHKKAMGFQVNNILINKSFNDITKIPRLRNRFSKKDFKELLINMLVSQRGHCTRNIVESIINAVYKRYHNYQCVVPIYGLIINNPISLFGITIYPYSQRDKFFDKCKYSTFRNDIHNKLTFATVTIKADAPRIAIQVSTKIIGSITNALTVAYSELNNIYNIKPGTYLYPYYGNEILVMSSKNSMLSPNQYFSSLWLILNDDKLNNNTLYKNYIKEIAYIQHKVIEHNQLSNIEYRFNNASMLIAEGIRSKLHSTKAIKFMSAIESLVQNSKLKEYKTKKNGSKYKVRVGISRQISNKIPVLFHNLRINNETPSNKRLTYIKYELHHLYKIRSDMAHGHIIWVNDDDIKNLWKYSKFALLIILQKYILRNKSQNDVNYDLDSIFYKFNH